MENRAKAGNEKYMLKWNFKMRLIVLRKDIIHYATEKLKKVQLSVDFWKKSIDLLHIKN